MFDINEDDNSKINEIKSLCERLGKAAKALGMCDESIACIEAQHELMRQYNDSFSLLMSQRSIANKSSEK